MKKRKVAKKRNAKAYDDVNAAPVKSFFVDMLTRDISLSDAILDLLDNCVDGILRKKVRRAAGNEPYKGYHAQISYDGDQFQITDNCGGIPWDLRDYAFRMGRPDGDRDAGLRTVGVFGIGMKRAVFKIGRDISIQTQHKNDAYDVEIKPSWLRAEKIWTLPVRELAARMKQDGTKIVVSKLYGGVRSLFDNDKKLFDQQFRTKVATHYAFIIDKGFKITVNGVQIKPKPTKLRWEDGPSKKEAIRPFIYETTTGGVEVFLAVGLTHPIPSEEDVKKEQEMKQHSTLGAGWTVVCNDRAVLYCDRSELTGWGEAGVPKYHPQFFAISGIVEFRSKDASKLPMTTTKRGIDASSRLYLQVKNKMRQGLQMFTDFTNKWKGSELATEAQERIARAKAEPLEGLRRLSRTVALKKVMKGAGGKQYKPRLPMPKKTQTTRRKISFVRELSEIHDVADYVFGDTERSPSEVGAGCFDQTLDEAHNQ